MRGGCGKRVVPPCPTRLPATRLWGTNKAFGWGTLTLHYGVNSLVKASALGLEIDSYIGALG